jgi:hypothetical protein
VSNLELWIPGIGLGIVALVTGVFSLFRSRTEGAFSKSPTVQEIWNRLDKIEKELGRERRARQTLRQVFLAYVQRVQTGGSSDLTPAERAALDDPEPEPEK